MSYATTNTDDRIANQPFVGRQHAIEAIFKADKTITTPVALVSGTATTAIQLPPGAAVVGVSVKIGTAWNSTTSDRIQIQSDESTPKVYLDTTATTLAAGNFYTAGTGTTAPLGFINTAPSNLMFKWTSGGGTPTTGTATVIVRYIVDGRTTFSQG